MVLKNRHRLKSKQIKQILSQLGEEYHQSFFSGDTNVDAATFQDRVVLLIDDDIDFFYQNNHLIITLTALEKYNVSSRSVIVDMGAVRFVTNGADIMAPGIVDADEAINVDDIVGVYDVTHHKALAVGRALLPGLDMKKAGKGKAVENLHFVGDDLWKFITASIVP